MAAALTFDAFAYAHQLREEGFTERQAEVLAKKTGEIIRIAIDSAKEEVQAGELATKRDLKEIELKLELLIEKSKNATLLWMFAMLTGFAGAIFAMLAKGFQWF